MLERGSRHFRASARLASALGAERLATWTRSQQRRLEEITLRERESSGYAVRARQLHAWATEVLA
jgi:hypothetical protein